MGKRKKVKLSRKKKINNDEINKADVGKVDELDNEVESGLNEQNGSLADRQNKERKLRKKRRKSDKEKKSGVEKVDELCNEVEDGSKEENALQKHLPTLHFSRGKLCLISDLGASLQGIYIPCGLRGGEVMGSILPLVWLRSSLPYFFFPVDVLCMRGLCIPDAFRELHYVSKKAHKAKKKARLSSKKDEKLLERREEPEQTEVYEMSSGDDDCSRGMKKWVTEYQQSRPGLKILQQRIDDFMTTFEAQEEQGRKKTTDAETGVTVGSVAQAAVLDNMAKKKSKDVGLDFYRFQKREAQRNEIMALQSKFEQDKKRIQQLRAARKFKPY
ncbi:hypothetical protein Acr_27g0007250 [Actinidia rufa]|uniref:Ribosomal RNA-processing protein 7 C-terminal domain-containing protein n=1 Tax=Actinidia rufa TaxID=165716 RepID=A0A7J0H7D2_9ERIC|nr:hypothetical protein Acr_27g0007250 [Actinidia rufa]